MEFFNSAIEVLQTLVVALGAGLGVWGAINLLEGYGNDNPGSKSCSGGHYPDSSAERSVRLRAAGGFSRLYIINLPICMPNSGHFALWRAFLLLSKYSGLDLQWQEKH